MPERTLMGGNIAVGEGALLAGCQAYFGYPITPQNDLLELMARRMPELGRVFLQTESELAAINMVYGAAAVGFRTMTSTSSPGFSLQQEGISYMAGAEMPAVIVNIMRAGPGLEVDVMVRNPTAAAPYTMLIAASSLSVWRNTLPSCGIRRAINSSRSFWGVMG